MAIYSRLQRFSDTESNCYLHVTVICPDIQMGFVDSEAVCQLPTGLELFLRILPIPASGRSTMGNFIYGYFGKLGIAISAQLLHFRQ